MPYDEGLAQRMRELFDDRGVQYTEKKMFGGVGFMIGGNMAGGVHKEALIIRVGPDAYDESLEKPHAKVFDITGRAMKGWIMLDAEGFAEDDDLRDWLDRGIDFASSLPAK